MPLFPKEISLCTDVEMVTGGTDRYCRVQGNGTWNFKNTNSCFFFSIHSHWS